MFNSGVHRSYICACCTVCYLTAIYSTHAHGTLFGETLCTIIFQYLPILPYIYYYDYKRPHIPEEMTPRSPNVEDVLAMKYVQIKMEMAMSFMY